MSTVDALDTYWNGRHVGVFVRDGLTITFHYDADASERPISLSLPRSGEHKRWAAANFLDNLLPDSENVRLRWARHLSVPSRAFDLLSRMGEDVAGALTLVPEGQDLSVSGELRFASEDEIADRIAAIRADQDAWLAPEQLGRARMSLAGAQGKFTLARVGDNWAWSNALVPSTHILKPVPHQLDEAPAVEAGAQLLAVRLGIPSARAWSEEFLGQNTYLTERFDRDTSTDIASRIHMEDIAQALSLPPERKYNVTAQQVIKLLGSEVSEQSQHDFIRLLAFNIAIGNADAHAKNYSIMLDGPIRLAPLYDALPTRLWPQFSPSLAMGISGAKVSQAVQEIHWRKLARVSGLDDGRVVDSVREVTCGVREFSHEAYRDAGASGELLDRLDALTETTTAPFGRPSTH